MTWRRRLRRRLLWAGVLLGLVLLLVAVSAARVCLWGRDLLIDNASRFGPRATTRKGGTMIRALTFFVGMAVAVVAIAPAALAEGRLAPLYPQPQAAAYRDAGERPAAGPGALDLAAAVGRLEFSAVRDAFTPVGHPPPYRASAPHRASGPHRGWTTTPPLAAKPTYATQPGKDAPARLAAARVQPRLFGGDTKPESATSGRDIEWSQLGIGVVIAIALAVGLALAVHAVRARPLAH